MNELRRKKIMKVMAVVLVAFGGSLLYFLFFNSGLNISPDPSNQAGSVIVSNDSVHAIRNITISYLVGGQRMGNEVVDVLLPREYLSISLDTQFLDNGKYTVQVSAPYHLSRQVVVQSSSNPLSTPTISFTFEFTPVGTQNQPVTILLSGKNLDSISHVLSASLELDNPAWGVNPPIQEWGLPPNGEGSLQLAFTPLAALENLSFKIKVFTPSTILVERSYTMLVLPDPDVNVMDANLSIDSNTFTDTNALSDDNSFSDTNSSSDENGSAS